MKFKNLAILLGAVFLTGCSAPIIEETTTVPVETTTETTTEVTTETTETTMAETTVKAPEFNLSGNVFTCDAFKYTIPSGYTVDSYSEDGELLIAGPDIAISITLENVNASKDMDIKKYMETIKPENAKDGVIKYDKKEVPAFYIAGTKDGMNYYQTMFFIPLEGYMLCITQSSGSGYIDSF